MTVTLRQRNKNGKISLYLDFYHKGKRKLEYLSLYLTEKPSTTEERALNKKTMQLAENIRAKRLLELQNTKFGFSNSERMNSNFLAYYELMAEKRCDSDGNYGNWLGALKHLKKWERSDVRFSDIDNIWLEDLKEYFLNDVKSKNGNKLSRVCSINCVIQ